MNTFLHTGDLGDVIASLPVFRELGGGHLVFTDHEPQRLIKQGLTPLKPMGPRTNLLRSLIAAQPYIKSVEFQVTPQNITHDTTDFRIHHSFKYSIAHAMAKYLNVPAISTEPWLEVEPAPVTKGRIIVARSPRYHNPLFPWKRIVAENRKDILFVGLDDEYKAFRWEFGPVERLLTPTLHTIAQAISGSRLFIGNQSCPCWIAMGLGHNLIQETHPYIRDSIIPRPNAQFVINGEVNL